MGGSSISVSCGEVPLSWGVPWGSRLLSPQSSVSLGSEFDLSDTSLGSFSLRKSSDPLPEALAGPELPPVEVRPPRPALGLGCRDEPPPGPA